MDETPQSEKWASVILAHTQNFGASLSKHWKKGFKSQH